MCRLAGYVSKLPETDLEHATIRRMTASIIHGGPDDEGIMERHPVYLGHRRLAVIDLTNAGHQPMFYEGYAIVYNGEIYNYAEIRRELEHGGFEFQSQSDTEVVLKAFIHWGMDCAKRFHGMFAMAICDFKNESLYLCRDRFGIKPLYYTKTPTHFMFASELKALMQHPNFDFTIDQNSVREFLHYGYISSPGCIFSSTRKLRPGTWMHYNYRSNNSSQYTYYDVGEVFNSTHSTTKPFAYVKKELKSRLETAFMRRLVSDVPVGIFLSGGIDSSLLASIIQTNTSARLSTFTIGFEERKFDESPYAKAIAKHLGTRHRELICRADDFKEVMEFYSDLYDEPFGDSSGVVTHLVSKLARQDVKVCLSADGADELFGGYSKYQFAARWYPSFVRRKGAKASVIRFLLRSLSTESLVRASHLLGVDTKYANIENKIYKLKSGLIHSDLDSFFKAVSGYDQDKILGNWIGKAGYSVSNQLNKDSERLISYLGVLDILKYLEGDILTKVDRATMRVGLEGREPFLDHQIVDYALQLPDEFKLRGGESKYILRALLSDYVPENLYDRPKQGFAVPIGIWLKNSYSRELERMIQDGDFLDIFQLERRGIKALVDNFLLDGRYVNEYRLWFIFILYRWYLRWMR